jgi:DNA polymerase-1
VTETGRLSSSDPNLQNIPIRTPEGRVIREAFIAEKGMSLISADYSQLELRILAHFCETGSLVEAFEQDLDIHEHTGRDLVAEGEEYNPSHRAAAKAINYGLMYGMSAFRLAKELRVPFKDANAYIERYFMRYPQVRGYMDSQIELAKENGFVETLLGRRRKISNINDRVRHIREGAERIAMNTPIQGTAADIVKVAMVQVEDVLSEEYPKARLLLQIHDELLIEAPDDQVEDVSILVQQTMEGAIKLKVPLKVHIGTGANWSQVH